MEETTGDDRRGYRQHYTEENFWEKLQAVPRSAGRAVLEKALTLRELLSDGETPLWVKGAIVGVLGYFILPADVIPDLLPGVGYADDVAAMAMILSNLDHFVTEGVRERVERRLGGDCESRPLPLETDEQSPGFEE